MELRQLRYFVAVAAHGSFSRAAGVLHLTQPAISRQVKSLEEELGQALLERGPHMLSLTEEGERVYEEARDLLAQADAMVRRARGHAGEETLRVGYVAAVASGILPCALTRFQAATPGVRLELSDLRPREIIERAAADLIDVAILPKGLEGKLPEYRWVEICQLSPVLVLPKKHPLARRAAIHPEQLRDLRLHGLGHLPFPEYAPRLRALLKCFGVKPVFAAQSADCMATLFAGLEAEGGVAVLTEGIDYVLPAFLVARPFSPALAPVEVVAGMPEMQGNVHAETFTKLLCTRQPTRARL